MTDPRDEVSHFHGFGQLAALQRHVHARDLRHLQREPGADGLAEAGGVRGHGVVARPQIRDRVRAAIVGHRGDADVRVDVGDRHGSIRHDRAGRVPYFASDRRRLLLRECTRWTQEDEPRQRQQGHHRRTSSLHGLSLQKT